MVTVRTLAVALLSSNFCSHTLAWQWPFQQFIFASSGAAAVYNSESLENVDDGIKRVAIIGAGAAGASTAYHLQKFAALSDVPIEITVFERSHYIGGRSTTVNAYNDPTHPVELGASIFVEVNDILKNATDQFGLRADSSETEEEEMLGIWNGENFVYTQTGGGWWNIAKLFWKYGLAPYKTQKLMKSTVGKFRALYAAPFFPFRSLSDRALDLGLTAITGVTGEQLLTANGIGAPFSTDIIQASTRVNYGQNLGLIHGLEAMVCMAIEGAMAIEGGNWKIFDGMIKAANATTHLNTTVTGIKKQNGKYLLSTFTQHTGRNLSLETSFDTVVLAAPFQYSDIELEDALLTRIPDKIPYVRLHVTLFTSIYKLNPVYFNIAPGAQVPDTILTTLPPGEMPANPQEGVGPAGFFSISTLRTLVNPKSIQKEYLYKIFSPEAVTADFLSKILETPVPELVQITNNEPGDPISWYYPHVWNSYPYEYPRVTFEDPELARGFYYTSGMESFISTMETNALMGMNVAQLILDDYVQLVEDSITGLQGDGQGQAVIVGGEKEELR